MEKSKIGIIKIISSFPAELLNLSLNEQKISIKLYKLLADGKPVSIKILAESLGLSTEVVDNVLNKWLGVYFDYYAQIIGYWGLTLTPTPHCLLIDSQKLYTWCAWDSLFIPEILGITAFVESECPITGEKISFTVTKDEVKSINPSGAVMSLITPEESKLRENVLLNFCHFVNFLNSTEAANNWISERPETFIVSIEEAYYLGQKKNEVQYKDIFRHMGV